MKLEDLLSRDGKIVYKTKGSSMEPMLRQNRDLVIIQTPSLRLKKYDVALYKRDDVYVLHRVIGVMPDCYLIRGDNTYTIETIPDTAVIGVLTGFKRKGKQHSVTEPGYRCYVRFWQTVYPLRTMYVRVRRTVGRAARKLGILSLLKKLFGKGDTT